MDKYKIFNYVFISVLTITGIYNIVCGFYFKETWQIIAGSWQTIAMAYWTMIPDNFIVTKKGGS